MFKFKELLVEIKRNQRKKGKESIMLVRQFWSVLIEHCSVVISQQVPKIGKATQFISPACCFGRLYCINRILHCYSLTFAVYRTNRSSWCITKSAMKTCPSGKTQKTAMLFVILLQTRASIWPHAEKFRIVGQLSPPTRALGGTV